VNFTGTYHPFILCHLLQKFCAAILLYGLESVSVSKSNIRTLISLWRNALFEVFKLKDDFNLLFIQYCFSILPIDYALDPPKLCLLPRDAYA